MIICKNNYDKVFKSVSDENQQLSEKLLEMLTENVPGEKHITSTGNSVSLGYSKCDEIIPFLMRNGLYQIAGPDFLFFSHARVRRNEDRLIYQWYCENETNEALTALSIDDILVKKDKYAKWDESVIANYQNMSGGRVIGLKDLNKKPNSFIIYNGLTGVFTNIWRKGNLHDRRRILQSFKEDLKSFQFFLYQVYLDNPNTQVYVCGLPNIQGTGIISILDWQIEGVCEKFPNAVFVKGTKRNAFFKLEGQQEFDVHYSKPEYLILWNKISRSMLDNYLAIRLKSSIASRIAKYSYQIEKQVGTTSKGSIAAIREIIEEEVEKYREAKQNEHRLPTALMEIAKYYNDNYLSDFPCTPREEVLKLLTELSFNQKTIEVSPKKSLLYK